LSGDPQIGIPAPKKGRNFQWGYKKHTGLGLFLVKEILAITGIIVTEKRTAGKGSRFEIIVPDGGYRIEDTDPERETGR